VKSHQPKQDLTQLNTPYAVCMRSYSLSSIQRVFRRSFSLSSIEKKTPGRKVVRRWSKYRKRNM